jgi:transposase
MSDDAVAQRFAEVLKLAFVDGLGVRAIARRLHVARKTVRKVLDRERRKRVAGPAAPRPTLLAAYDGAIRQMLSDTPELKAPAVLERLRPLGYRGGVTIVRDRLRQCRWIGRISVSRSLAASGV